MSLAEMRFLKVSKPKYIFKPNRMFKSNKMDAKMANTIL